MSLSKSLFCAGTRHLYYGKFPPGAEYCVYHSICVAFCFEYILSIYMKCMDESVNRNVNLVLIGQHSN